MGSAFIVITAQEAAEHAALARAHRRQQAIDSIPGLEETDPLIYDGLQVIFRKVEESFHQGATSANFHMDKLFGEGRWRKLQQKLTNILGDLGYKVNYSCSSNACNEWMYLSWDKPKV